MNKNLLIGILLLPCPAIADDCRMFEYPDHYEVVCEGDSKPVIVQSPTVQSPIAVQPQTPEPRKEEALAEKSAPSQAAEPVKKAVPTVSHTQRQRRPPTADREAAAEARRSLILEQRLMEPSVPAGVK